MSGRKLCCVTGMPKVRLDESKQRQNPGGHDWTGGVFPILAGVYKGTLWMQESGLEWLPANSRAADCLVDIVRLYLCLLVLKTTTNIEVIVYSKNNRQS